MDNELKATADRNFELATKYIIELETEKDPARRAVTKDLLRNAVRRYRRAADALKK